MSDSLKRFMRGKELKLKGKNFSVEIILQKQKIAIIEWSPDDKKIKLFFQRIFHKIKLMD